MGDLLKLKQAIVFAILMQNNQGILYKAPCYVMEKLESAFNLEKPEVLLDSMNILIFRQYLQKWGIEGGKDEDKGSTQL